MFECFRECYIFEEFIKRQLNYFNSLRQGTRIVLEYETQFMELLRYVAHLNIENLWVGKIVYGLNFNIGEKV